jgi:hypothetical protein
MSIRVEYLTVLGLPVGMVLGLLAAYWLAVAVGVDRELALDSVTVALVLGVVSMLRGLHKVPDKTWSLEFGTLLAVVVAVGALALRSISLVSSRGPLLYFTLVSQVCLVYVARRIVRDMARWAASGADARPAPPRDAPPRD